MTSDIEFIVRRSGALGDVVLTTPIIRRLRRENPDANINVATGYRDVFRGSPHLTSGLSTNGTDKRLIQLDLAYERRPEMHIVQAYMEEAFGDLGCASDLQQELFFPRRVARSAHRYVAVHATVAGWMNRTLPRAVWREVVEKLGQAGLWPILVGSARDDIPGCEVTRFFSTDILAQAGLIQGCAAFVGSDSGLLHIAGATDVPIVGVFTCAMPHTRLPWRHGQLGWNCTSIVPDIDCAGCLARRVPPVTTEFCPRGDTACVTLVSAKKIVDAVIEAVDRQ